MQIAVMIKPEGMPYLDEILDGFDERGKRIEAEELVLTNELFDEFYGHFATHPRGFYPLMKEDMVGKNVFVAIYEGDFGKFEKFKIDTLRNVLKGRIKQLPDAGYYVRNGVHSSSDAEMAEREVDAARYWFNNVRSMKFLGLG